jgi:hypothetical protein
MTTISDNNAEELRDARRKKSLGELGELFAIKTLVDHEFDRIRNLNDTHANEPFADVICEKNGHRYVISVKARNKYQLNGKLNTRYNLGSNSYANARSAGEKYQARPYWMAIQFSEHHYSVFFGSL